MKKLILYFIFYNCLFADVTAHNPTDNILPLEYYLSANKNLSIKLYNNKGMKVKEIISTNTAGNHQCKIDISSLAANTYVLIFDFDGVPISEKK